MKNNNRRATRYCMVVVVCVLFVAEPLAAAVFRSACSTSQSCVVDGIQYTALGNATLAINPAGHIVVSNIGVSGENGVALSALPSATRGFVANFGCPNFLDSAAGAIERVTVYADVPSGVLYRFTVENIGHEVMRMTPDFSSIGATRYSITILNDGVVTGTFNDLPSAIFQMAQDDQTEVN